MSLYAVVSRLKRFYSQKAFDMLGKEVERKKWYLRPIFFIVRMFHNKKTFNFLVIFFVIIFASRKVRKPSFEGGVFQLAPSRNNRRAFERLNKVLSSEERKVDLNGEPVPLSDRLAVVASFCDLVACAKVLSQEGDENPFTHVQLIIGCASFLLFNYVLLKKLPRSLCVANDHVPVCVASLFSAKRLGVSTCYIQHAPVTRYFPPLDFDVSLLFDRESKAIYEKISLSNDQVMSGRVIIFSPFESEFSHPRVDSLPLTVGICLSFLPDDVGLARLVKELIERPEISMVFLRRHPRCRREFREFTMNEKVIMQERGGELGDFLSKIDVALVPSSGVAIEALHSGVPTFYVPRLDRLEDDYYGFVRREILPKFNSGVLSDVESINSFFDEGWVGRFGCFDETVYQKPGKTCEEVSKVFDIL